MQDLIEEKTAWGLLRNIMKTYKLREKTELPYSAEEIKELKHSVFKWVFSLKPFDQKIPENFVSLVEAMKNGIVLGNIVKRIKNIDIKLIKYPNNRKESSQNIETVLKILQKEDVMSQGYTWDTQEILKGSEIFVLALLEDLHRFANGLPKRRPGDQYHSDGPFFGNFNPDNLNISRIEEKNP